MMLRRQRAGGLDGSREQEGEKLWYDGEGGTAIEGVQGNEDGQ